MDVLSLLPNQVALSLLCNEQVVNVRRISYADKSDDLFFNGRNPVVKSSQQEPVNRCSAVFAQKKILRFD